MTHRIWLTVRRLAAKATSRSRRRQHRVKSLRLELLEDRQLMSADGVQPLVTRIINGTPTSAYPSVGIIGDASGGFCSGTLIAPRFALTAGHCGEGVGNTAGRFTIGGQTYATSHVYVHPTYNNQTLANDLAIFELGQSVSGITPSPIFRGTPQVGQMLTLVGFGAGGTGSTGQTGDFGTKRVGQTPIDSVEPTLITWNFDNNSESNTAPGDSGGPAFLMVNAVEYLAGVTSGGTRDDAGLGDTSFDTRVDALASWIDSIAGNVTPPPPGDDHVNVPGSSATTIALNSSGEGSRQGILEVAGDRDVFQFQIASAGTAVIGLTAGTNSLDTYLRIYNSAGTLVAQNDDYGPSLNSQVTLSVQPGTYYASAGSYLDAGTGNYNVTVKATTSGDKFANAVAIPLSNDGKGAASSSITSTTTSRMYAFVASYTGQMTATTKATSGDLDTILTAYDSSGRRLAMNDDYGRTLNSRVQFNVVAGAKYYLEVTRYGRTTGSFNLDLSTTSSLRTRGNDAPTVGTGNRQQQPVLSSASRRTSEVFVSASPASAFGPVLTTRGASQGHTRMTDYVLSLDDDWLSSARGW